MSTTMKFGNKDIPFVYKGDKLIYPNPIRDGLLLWYDFKGMRNTDTNKEVAKDLSGNGNDGQLQNFNFTEESGYKDNKLVFDGVDDKLTIPELELDETSMTVRHDGKLYAYEDDKILTVGEDGEIVGSGENLLQSSKEDNLVHPDIKSTRQFIFSGWASQMYQPEDLSALIEGETYTLSYDIEIIEVSPETDVFSSQHYIRLYSRDSVYDWNLYQKTSINMAQEVGLKHSHVVTFIAPAMNNHMLLGYSGRYLDIDGNPSFNTVKITNLQLVKGGYLSYTPAPSDYKSTSFSSGSFTDLQLYNKTLRKDELLRNAESEGLKQLKDGVVVQDGLVLHYDFSHESNTSEYKEKAFDYSGNGNHGALTNFAYAEGSGYEEGGLRFDNVDDYVSPQLNQRYKSFTITSTVHFGTNNSGMIWGGTPSAFYLRRNLGHGLHGSIYTAAAPGVAGAQLSTTASNTFITGESKKINVGMIVDNENLTYSLVANGEIVRSVDIGEQSGAAAFLLTHVGTWPTLNYENLDGSLYSFHMYDRALTPEEIQHNYTIEKEKYNL